MECGPLTMAAVSRNKRERKDIADYQEQSEGAGFDGRKKRYAGNLFEAA